jgi:CHAT domain-containing protein
VSGLELRRQTAALERERSMLDQRIRREDPRYAEVRYPLPVELQTVQRRLGPNQVLLEYSLGERRSVVFAVTRDRLVACDDLPAADAVRTRVGELRAALTSPSRALAFGAFVRVARRLHDELLACALDRVDPGAELVIVPDGPLHFVPFEVLLTAEAGPAATWADLPYLVRRQPVGYTPSASVLARLESQAPAPAGAGPRFIGFGDPVASGDAGPFGNRRPAALAHSEEEVRRIAELFGDRSSVVYLGAEATEENVKDNPLLRQAQWVHFATHGVVDAARPRRSGLLLARSEGSAEDGVLSMGEVFNLELGGALVVLSACETGLGKEVSGEGVVGFTRAFLYAGARNVLISLWPVEDRSTAELMIAFKRSSDRQGALVEALQEAKRELLDDGRYADPRYWAPFVLVGTPLQGGETDGTS